MTGRLMEYRTLSAPKTVGYLPPCPKSVWSLNQPSYKKKMPWKVGKNYQLDGVLGVEVTLSLKARIKSATR